MAQAARKTRARAEVRPRLEAVTAQRSRPRSRKPASPRRASSAEIARWAAGFRSFLVVVLALGAVACGRVALTTRAAEATLSSGAIAEDIKAEELAADKLEVSKNSLATPSRIRDIAGVSLEMVEPGRVEYLDLPDEPDAAAVQRGPAVGGLKRLIAAAMDLAAGEAQVLLVGDVGLASSR